MSIRTGLRVLSLLACVLAACGSESDELVDSSSDALSVPNDATDVAVHDERSLVVTSPAALATVDEKFSFGRVMAQIAKGAGTPGGMGFDEHGAPFPSAGKATDKGTREWIEHIFLGAIKEMNAHAAAPQAARLGVVPAKNPMQHVLDLWHVNGGVEDGPFRLLAVVNRLDLAGDVDARDCCAGAARVARPFGEGRLVFGLVDPEMEKGPKGKAYPLTMIVEFRLPALAPDLTVMSNRFDYDAVLQDDAAWRTQMERWGKVWQEQSRHAPNEKEFQSRLLQVISRFAQPENFLSIRSGFEVEDDKGKREFEYREWYIVGDDMALIPRKPRREPYRCGSEGNTLGVVADGQWNEKENDLEMRGHNGAGKSISYNVPRDNASNPGQNGPMKGCARDGKGNGVPFEMNGDSRSGEHRDVNVAPFSRFDADDVWDLSGVKGDAKHREDVRHAFAIRTCSGCHGKEAGLFGFQISPRLKNEESKLADFMTGRGGVQFQHDGAGYHYDDLRSRHTFLERAAKHDPTLEMYSGLFRHDRQ